MRRAAGNEGEVVDAKAARRPLAGDPGWQRRWDCDLSRNRRTTERDDREERLGCSAEKGAGMSIAAGRAVMSGREDVQARRSYWLS